MSPVDSFSCRNCKKFQCHIINRLLSLKLKIEEKKTIQTRLNSGESEMKKQQIAEYVALMKEYWDLRDERLKCINKRAWIQRNLKYRLFNNEESQ